MTALVLYDTLIKAYYIYDSEEREVMSGCDDKVMYDKLEDLPEEFFGSSHSYLYEELDFSIVKGM